MKQAGLIGNSGVQFLDLELDLGENSAAMAVKRDFCELVSHDGQGAEERTLIFPVLDPEGNAYLNPDDNKPVSEDQIYTIHARQAIECFEGKWVPVPYFRSTADGKSFHEGPTNWARVWFNPIARGKETRNTHNIVLAFDTMCPKRDNGPYLAPEPNDLNNATFNVAVEPDHNLSFIAGEWVQSWVTQIYEQRKKDIGFAYTEEHFIYIGLYLTLLSTLQASGAFPSIVLHESQKYIEVDLILDAGNSRSCGLLLQSARGNEPVSFTNCTRLALRDLSIPDRTYDDPFEMRVEFVKAEFGDEASSMLSGRRDAFCWPSLVRVGPESARLSVINDSTMYYTGMSSPKRYLWDTDKRESAWMFNGPSLALRPEPALNAFSALFTEDGEFIMRDESFVPGLNSLYSRSSTMVFALAEIFLHAISQINSFAYRKHHGQATLTRRLKRVVLTCPTAMLDAEKKILRSHAKDAMDALKESLGKEVIDPDMCIIPDPDLIGTRNMKDWGYDEATCVQLSFLYGEIHKRFSNDAHLFFETLGKKRPDSQDPTQPSVTVACLDIGGGTSDLMICDYQRDPTANDCVLQPNPMFWEGFNLAGDNILRRIIERIVLPAIHDKAEEMGCENAAETMNILFGPDHGSQSVMARARRKQFANQVAVPIALGIIQHATNDMPIEHRDFNSFFINFPAPHPEVLAHVNTYIQKKGAHDFRVEDVTWGINTQETNTVIRQVMQEMVGSLCGVISQFDCDYLLLAGRPTVLPVIREIFLQYLPLMPDRIILMGRYRIGNWYPFADPGGLISDPKTCVCVGAAVGLMASTLGRLSGFRISPEALKEKITSTANYIGYFDPNRLQVKDVYFEDDDSTEAEFIFHGPMLIGMRQMDSPDWLAAPMYRVNYATLEIAQDLVHRLPLTVTIRRSQNNKEAIFNKPVRVADKEGRPVPSDKLTIKPQTLVDEKGHWLDTGSFLMPRFSMRGSSS